MGPGGINVAPSEDAMKKMLKWSEIVRDGLVCNFYSSRAHIA